MPIPNNKKKNYRLIGHNLKPIVTVAGKGLSEGVMAELNRALDDHELIKVRLAIIDRDARKATITQMCTDLKAETVQEIGKVALIFRQSSRSELRTSNIR